MNTFKTVGGLIKALSAYDENLRFEFSLDNQTIPNAINNDTAIFQIHRPDSDEPDTLHIALLSAIK